MKECAKCHRLLPESCFYVRRDNGRLQSHCIDCCKAHGRLRNGYTGIYRKDNTNLNNTIMDKIVAQVYETYDYDKFHIMEKGNRDITHFEKIARQMKDIFLFTVIIVNDKYEIIDGQNRFMASRKLGKPIRYVIVEGYGVEETRLYNMEARNWQKKDFIRSYADQGNEEYVKIIEFQKRYRDFPSSVCEYFLRMSMCADSSEERGKNTFKSIQRGLFIVKNFERSCEIADMVMAYKQFCNEQKHPIYKRKEFVSAIIKLSRLDEFDNDLVVRKLKLNPRSFVPCLTSNEYIRMLEDIFNYRNKNKVRFNV